MAKILIVDDEEHLRYLYSEELCSIGHDIVEAENGHRILDRIEQEKPDIVLLDIKLGNVDNKNDMEVAPDDLDGLKVLQKIRNNFYDMPVILITAYDTYKEKLEALAADYYFIKSFDLTELKNQVDLALEASSLLSGDSYINSREIIRTFKFTRDNFEAGMALLNYIEKKLEEFNPELNISTRIIGLTVRIYIRTTLFDKENIEEILEDYGAILKGEVTQDKPPFIRSELEIVINKAETLLMPHQVDYQKKEENVREMMNWLTSYINERLHMDIGTLISVEMIGGCGILTDIPSTIILRITNNDVISIERLDVEIVSSGDYKIIGKKKDLLGLLNPQESKKATFIIQSKFIGEITLNVKINGSLITPALRITVIRDNPYVYGTPIEKPTYFFGRKQELEEILQCTTKPAKQDLLLLGERRSGKTSLLYRLKERIKSPFIPVYVVLNVAQADPKSVLKLILKEIIMNLIMIEVLDSSIWLEYEPKGDDLTRELQNILKAAKEETPETKLVLLIDEADYLLVIDDHLQNILRATLQSGEVGSQIRAVFAGTNELKKYVSKRSSPFFNQFRFVRLDLLSKPEIYDLITVPAESLGYRYKEEAISNISLACGGHPYYCQLTCYEVFDIASKIKKIDIDEKICDKAIRKVSESEGGEAFEGFQTYFWDTATKEEREFMTKLADTRKDNNRIGSAPRRLIDWQVIKKKASTYEFTSMLFKDWARKLGSRLEMPCIPYTWTTVDSPSVKLLCVAELKTLNSCSVC